MANLILVDDDEDFAETLKDVFELHHHAVTVAATGEEALEALQGNEFDVLLLDWQLPDMSGLDVCRRYRESGGGSPVLMLTGMRDAASRQSGKDAGATDFLTKPFSIQQLLTRLQNILSGAAVD